MKNITKLFSANPRKDTNILLFRNGVHFIYYEQTFDGNTIKDIINFVNGVKKKFKNAKMPIYFEFKNPIEIKDKLAYIIFECICYTLMEQYGHIVYVFWEPKEKILTDGIFSSPLLLLNSNRREAHQKFPKKFQFDTFKRHYRRVIKKSNEENYLGIVLSEIATFLKSAPISEDARKQVAEVVSELVGNAGEHADSDCLIDIDVTNPHEKLVDGEFQNDKYIGINIAILNFSEKLLNGDLKQKITQNHIPAEKYQNLYNVYRKHKLLFEDDYLEDDFWNISCLQDKISGRLSFLDANQPGGTGSTVLIKSLQEKADKDNCYLLSGNRVIFFLENFLTYDKNGWLSFNEENDFVHYKPAEGVVSNCPVYFPGTAFNLNFVMKMEE
ncbi:hypothetical protein [Enterococcus sp. DIV0385]|uniref:hypothetical protein n=1 Tax=Enterococcus sp. DIV0385 TaxID=2775003 RepID=UPI000A33A381